MERARAARLLAARRGWQHERRQAHRRVRKAQSRPDARDGADASCNEVVIQLSSKSFGISQRSKFRTLASSTVNTDHMTSDALRYMTRHVIVNHGRQIVDACKR